MPGYISKNRAMLRAISSACQRLGIQQTLFSDDWVIKLDKGAQRHFVYIYDFDINTQSSASIAVDKVSTYQLLNQDGLAAVPHYLLSSAVEPEVDELTLQDLHGKHAHLVIKPARGSRGKNIAKFDTHEHSLKFTVDTEEVAWSASPFIDIEYETRLVFYKGILKLAYRKYDAPIINNLKMFNINLGAKVGQVDIKMISADMLELGKKSMEAIGLTMGAVDIVTDQNGNLSTLEINSGFSLEHYALVSDENYMEVVDFYESIVEDMFTN